MCTDVFVILCISGDYIAMSHREIITNTIYPTQSHYPDTALTSPFPILLMLSAQLG